MWTVNCKSGCRQRCDVVAGKYNIFFCAPEAIIGCKKWIERAVVDTSDCIVAVAIDEAHRLSKW